jgi:SHS2 domain-containing protein
MFPPSVRWGLPQPFEDLGHTADVGVRVRGGTAEEALARLALALGTLLTGGAPAAVVREERVLVQGGPGLAGSAVALLRELLFRFATERLVPASISDVSVGEDAAEALVGFAGYDPSRHEGADVKAVTWHAARLEREGDGWVGQAVFDI